MGGIFGGGSKTHDTTTSSQYPADVQALQSKLIAGADKAMQPFLNDPTTQIAPRNTFQDRAQVVANDTLDWMVPRRYGDQAMSYLGATSDTGMDRSGQVAGYQGAMDPYMGQNYSGAGASTIGAGMSAMPAASHIERVGMDDVAAMSNPYMNDMMDVQIGRIDDDHQKRSADTAMRAATRGAFGGSGEAIGQFLNDKNTAEQVQNVARETAYDSYGQGAQLALANQNAASNAQDRFINTILQSAGNDRAGASTADALDNSYFNRGMNSNQFDLNALLSADNLTNSAYNRNRGSFDDNMTALTTTEALDRGYLDRVNSAGAGVVNNANALQSHQQSMLDAPYTAMSRFASFVPGYQPTTTSSQPIYSNPMQSALGALTLGNALF